MEQGLEEKETDKKVDEKGKTKTNEISFYICCFLVYCFIGWIYEVTWEFAIGNSFVNRGFLHGCYLPIYGFGTLALYFVLNKLMKKKIKVWKITVTPILVFLSILAIASTIEYITSWAMEMLFDKRWWDYSYDILNINGRVSLRNSSILSAGAMLFLYGVEPLLRKFFSRFSKKTLKYMAIIIATVISIDLITVIIGYLH